MFDPVKISSAMQKAFSAESVSVDTETIQQMTDRVVAKVSGALAEGEVPSVERVQDIVEETLMERGYFVVAKHYILYRFQHTTERKEQVVQQIEENKLMVVKRDGRSEAFSREKVRAVVSRAATGFEQDVDIDDVVKQVEFEVYDGIKTTELARLITLVLRSRIEDDPAYSYAAARQLCGRLYTDALGKSSLNSGDFDAAYKEAFIRNIKQGVAEKKIAEDVLLFDLEKLAGALKRDRDDLFKYLGVETLHDRYFIRSDEGRVLETPQYMWMRVAIGLSINEEQKEDRAIEFYNVMSTLRFVPSTPTLFHSATPRPQLSSCYLNVVEDDLKHIFKVYGDNAQLSKWAGGIGTAWSKLRATGALIKTAGITSQGTVPFLKIANDVTVAINRSGRRRGATCVYMENWHYDFEDFLELRKNTGDERRRTHDIDSASWISDLFMKRVKEGGQWTLFSPEEVPELTETFGKTFEEHYKRYEEMADRGEIKLFKRMQAADLWKKMLGMLFETGHPWVTFKDPSNIRSPQDHAGVVHSSNLCTEITLNTSAEETAVCNLGSVNLALHVSEGVLHEEKIKKTVTTAMRMLDNVIDLNFYPTEEAKNSNMKHRPVGLGVMGFQDALYKLNINFASEECVKFADRSQEMISYYTILASTELARERGSYQSFSGSKWDRGILPIDTVALLEAERGVATGIDRSMSMDWSVVREAIRSNGMRNSNTMAIAPTATIGNISGVVPGIEPIYKNIYVKANISGDFVVVNAALVEELKQRGLWSKDMLSAIKYHDGSVQEIADIPQDIKDKYKETFEIDMRWIIRAAAARGKWIDQSQSLNMFFSGSSGQELSELYLYAWEMGLKTTYYLRTLAATQVEKSTVSSEGTHLRKNDDANLKKEEVQTTSQGGTPSPLPTPSPMTQERIQEGAVTVENKEQKKYNLHIAEDEICESCQ